MSEEILKEETEAVEKTDSSEVSKSKAKREARKAEAKAAKSKKNFDVILGWVVGIVVAVVVIGVIAMGIITTSKTASDVSAIDPATMETPNFSYGISEEGFIEKANLENVTDLNVESLEIALADVDFTEEDIDAEIESLLASKKTFETDAALEVKDGDTINLDYVGSVDGVEFDGGSTNGAGATLVIGSGSYIDDFEEQLIGSHPGDAVTVNVTFPDPYSGNADLSGKEAVFECTVNSIQVTPELTDAFVAENFSEQGSDIASLRANIKENGLKNNISSYFMAYIADNASATKVPKDYVANLEKVELFTDYQNYQSTAQMYAMYGMAAPSYSEYLGMEDSEYKALVKEDAEKEAAKALTYELILNKNGLIVSEDIYNEFIDMLGADSEILNTYGTAFIRQVALQQTVIDFLVENAVVK